jgi:hypothetical protein
MSDGAENGRIATFFVNAASRAKKWLAHLIQQFCPSPPQPTARLLSCHQIPSIHLKIIAIFYSTLKLSVVTHTTPAHEKPKCAANFA